MLADSWAEHVRVEAAAETDPDPALVGELVAVGTGQAGDEALLKQAPEIVGDLPGGVGRSQILFDQWPQLAAAEAAESVQLKGAEGRKRATTRRSPKRKPGVRRPGGPVGETSFWKSLAAGLGRQLMRSMASSRRL